MRRTRPIIRNRSGLPGQYGPLLAAVLIFPLIPELSAGGRKLYSDDFRHGIGRWAVEQQPGGTIAAEKGTLVIRDVGGCTVWFRPKLNAPVSISYVAKVAAKPRVSDLNCFWMATDPARPGDLLAPGHRRDGSFASYDSLRTYYVGYGGNDNTTTRFRRYAGDGSRPLLPEHDLKAPEVLLRPDEPYRITLVVVGERIQFIRNGQVIFDIHDPQPLTSGWFGFRTVQSHIEVRDFVVREASTKDLLQYPGYGRPKKHTAKTTKTAK